MPEWIQKVLLTFLIAAAAIAPISVAAQASPGCSDDFASGLAKWTFLDADSATGGSMVDTGGTLALTGKGQDIFGTVNEFVAATRSDIQGDFDVSVEIQSQDSTNAWAQAGILAANNVKDLSQGGYAIVDVTPGNGYVLFYDKTQPQGTLDTYVQTGTTAYPVWLRLAKTSGKFSAWYRNQTTAAWTQITANVSALGTATNSQLALFSVSHNTAMSGKTVFDDFACTQGTVALLPWRRTSLRTSVMAFQVEADGRIVPVATALPAVPALISVP